MNTDMSHLRLLTINKIDFSVTAKKTWSVYFYEDFRDCILLSDGTLRFEFEKLIRAFIDQNFQDFKTQVEINGIQIMIGFFYRREEVRLYSPRLGQELFLLEEFAKEKSAVYLELKKHVEKITNQLSTMSPSILDIITHRYGLPDFLRDSRYFDLEYDLGDVIQRLMRSIEEYNPKRFEKVFNWLFYRISRIPLVRNRVLEYLFIIITVDDESGDELKKNLSEALSNFQNSINVKEKDKLNRQISTKLFYSLKIISKLVDITPPPVLKKGSDFILNKVASKFIASERVEDIGRMIKRLSSTKRDISFDHLGEHLDSYPECEKYLGDILLLIDKINLHLKKDELNKAGIPKKYISIKISALSSDIGYHAPDEIYKSLGPRVQKILKKAKETGTFVCFDSEQYEKRELLFYTISRIFKENEDLRGNNLIGITLQAYFRDAFECLEQIIKIAKDFKTEVQVRLVKGAYWDEEVTCSRANGWQSTVFLNKEETDLHYRQLMVKILENASLIRLLIASHNPQDHAFSEVLRKKYFKTAKTIEHQCLDQTNEALSRAMVQMGWAVRNHVPVGPVFEGLGYLIRRIMENSSQLGVLSILKNQGKKKLETPIKTHLDKKKKMKLVDDETFRELTSSFKNIAPVKTFLQKSRDYISSEITKLASEDYYLEFESNRDYSGPQLEVRSPETNNILLGKVNMAQRSEVTQTINQLSNVYNEGSWAKKSEIIRISIIIGVANLLTARRHEFAALVFKEAGINIVEAYREVDFAIDYLNFHAREQNRLKKKNAELKPRGVVAVFPAWSSPLASVACYTSAALASGNVVIIKPAIQTPLISFKLVELFYEAGLPQDVLKCLIPEEKEDLELIIDHKDIAVLAYEGPLNLAKNFYSRFSKKIINNQLYNIKYKAEAVLSLGGKNGMIITASADIDMAIRALFSTTFCRSGQMASCPTRIIVDSKIKNKFLSKLKLKLEEIIDSSFDGVNRKIDPIIDSFEIERLQKIIQNAKAEISDYAGTIIWDRTEDYKGQFIGPLVVTLDAPRASKFESLACRELYGPIIYVIEYDNLEDAAYVFNSGEYVRTGSVYSQSSEDIKYLVDNLLAGSIHINKDDLQTRVAVMPHGGFKLSGTGPKMGGKGLLYAFMVNYMRESEPEEVEEGRGSDYRFSLMRPSGLSLSSRLLRLSRVMDIIIQHFEPLFQGLYGDYKDNLIQFNKWIKKDFVPFHLGPHENQRVAGEDNFNDFKKVGEQAVFLVYNPRVEFPTFMRFLGALIMGVGITVIARNEKAFSWWSTLKGLILKAGISKQNFDVFFPTEELLYQAIQEPCLSYIIIDSNVEKIEELLKVIFTEDDNVLRFKKVMTPHNAPNLRDYKQYLSEFTWIRSISISSKRKGIDIGPISRKLSDYSTTDEYFWDM